MKKGFVHKREFEDAKSFHVWEKDGGFDNYVHVAVLEMAEVEELRKILSYILPQTERAKRVWEILEGKE